MFCTGIIDFYKFLHLEDLATDTELNHFVMFKKEKMGHQKAFCWKNVAITTKKPGNIYIISGEE